MGRRTKRFVAPAGSPVFIHQAFRCCPYAAMVTSKIHDFLEANSYLICETPEESDIAIINTCGFNASRAEQGERVIELVRRRAPRAAIVVCGCLTVIERNRIQRVVRGAPRSAMIGPREPELFDEIFEHPSVGFERVRTNMYKERYSAKDPRLGLYQVLVSLGCLNQCRYCVIRRAKGNVNSKPLPAVVDEVRQGVRENHRDIFLVGDDISCYGADIGTDAVELLRTLAALEEDCRYSFEAFEPSRFLRMLDDLIPSFQSGRFSWIVLPVQSGSDRVLRSMGRNYTCAEIEKAIGRLRAAAPEMIISTDFIFGYPTETRGDLKASLEMTKLFDYSNFNEYEQRPGTPAADLPPVEMERRRKMVGEFLAAQGSQIGVLTRNRLLPYDTWTGKDGDPQREMMLRQWVASTVEKIGGGAGLVVGTDLAGGWMLTGVEEERGGVVLVVSHRSGDETMKFLLSPPDENSPCLAYSPDYNVSLVAANEISAVDEGKRAAIAVLGKMLDLKWKK